MSSWIHGYIKNNNSNIIIPLYPIVLNSKNAKKLSSTQIAYTFS